MHKSEGKRVIPSGYQMDSAEEDDQMLTCELEAAEALAGLARCSALPGGGALGPVKESTGQAIAVHQSLGNTSTIVTSALKIEDPVSTLSCQLGSSHCQSDSYGKSNRNLTEAEREARRLRRVLANRESARQTIRRRQAMHLELTRKAADLSEENEKLKKDQELALEEYNSLKVRNEFLKLQMTNVKKADEPREMQEEPKSSEAEISNQPSLVPFFHPTIFPSPNIIQLQYASHSDVMYSPQFSMQNIYIPSLHRGEENSSGISGSGNPLFVLPVLCLHPFLSHNTTLHSHSDTDNRQNETSSTSQCITTLSSDTIFGKDKQQSEAAGHKTGDHPRTTTLLLPEKSSVRSVRHSRNSHEDHENYNLNVVSVCEHSSRSILRKNAKAEISCEKKSENVFASEARRRRKELMKMKNANCRHVGTPSCF